MTWTLTPLDNWDRSVYVEARMNGETRAIGMF